MCKCMHRNVSSRLSNFFLPGLRFLHMQIGQSSATTTARRWKCCRQLYPLYIFLRFIYSLLPIYKFNYDVFHVARVYSTWIQVHIILRKMSALYAVPLDSKGVTTVAQTSTLTWDISGSYGIYCIP